MRWMRWWIAARDTPHSTATSFEAMRALRVTIESILRSKLSIFSIDIMVRVDKFTQLFSFRKQNVTENSPTLSQSGMITVGCDYYLAI